MGEEPAVIRADGKLNKYTWRTPNILFNHLRSSAIYLKLPSLVIYTKYWSKSMKESVIAKTEKIGSCGEFKFIYIVWKRLVKCK